MTGTAQEGYDVKPIEIDAIDEELIRALKKDGRASYASLAPLVGLSQAAVRARVQRLLDSGAIAIMAIPDPAVLGVGIEAVCCVEVSGSALAVAERLRGFTEATFVVATAGRYDLVVELQCTSQHHLFEALERIRAIDGVANVDSLTYLHIEQHGYSGGTLS